jgi:hypothetical protein
MTDDQAQEAARAVFAPIIERLQQNLGPRKKVSKVRVTVSWGNDEVEVSLRLTRAEWETITKGEEFSKGGRGYYYEGERFHDYWYFNNEHPGSLEVTYDDGGQGFVGDLDDALIEAS